jgi:hypothetical protein
MKLNNDQVIESMSIVQELFNLDHTDYRILEYFTKNGEVTRHHVGIKVGRKFHPYLTKKQISRRIDKLAKLDFLILKEIRPFKNLKGVFEKDFGLTLKGFLASLLYCKLEDNQFFKKYIEFMIAVDNWQEKNIDDVYQGKSNKISPIITKIVNLQLEHFFNHNYIRGITLDTMKNIPSWFDVYDNSHGISSKDLKNLEKDKNKISILFDGLDVNNDINSKYHEDVFLWSTYWIHVISFISQGFSKNKILTNLRKNFPSEFVTLVRKEKEKQLEEEIKKLIKVDSKASDIFYRQKSRRN